MLVDIGLTEMECELLIPLPATVLPSLASTAALMVPGLEASRQVTKTVFAAAYEVILTSVEADPIHEMVRSDARLTLPQAPLVPIVQTGAVTAISFGALTVFTNPATSAPCAVTVRVSPPSQSRASPPKMP